MGGTLLLLMAPDGPGLPSASLRDPAGLLMVTGGVLAALGGVVTLCGLALYVLTPAFSRDGSALRDYGSHRVVLACTALAAVVGNALAAIYFLALPHMVPGASGLRDLSGSRVLSPEGIVVAATSLDIALLAVAYVRVVRPGAISWQEMGIRRGQLMRGFAIGLPFGVLLFLVSTMLELLLHLAGVRQTQGAMFQSVARASTRQFLMVLLAGAAVAPAAEEIFFRGYVFRAYLRQKGVVRAYLFSAGLFALVHLDMAALLPIFVVGLLLSFLYHRTGSVLPGMVAHGFNNALAFTLLYLGLG